MERTYEELKALVLSELNRYLAKEQLNGALYEYIQTLRDEVANSVAPSNS